MVEQTTRAPLNKISERAHHLVVRDAAAFFRLAGASPAFEEGGSYILGLLVGVAEVALCCTEKSDEAHAEVRSVIASVLHDAFDLARQHMNLPPLPKVQ